MSLTLIDSNAWSIILDGIDGKQARRTGTSGPLGELFDHGLDSWTTFFIPACIWSIFGRADYSISPLRFYFILWNVLSCFYTSHWEKYLTKILFLPWGYDISQAVRVFCNYYFISDCKRERGREGCYCLHNLVWFITAIQFIK